MTARGVGITPARRELAQGSRKGNPQSFVRDQARGGRGGKSCQRLCGICDLVLRPRLFRAVAADLVRSKRQAIRCIHLLPRWLAQPAGFAVQFGASAADAAGFAWARIFVGSLRHRPAADVHGQALAAGGRQQRSRSVRASGANAANDPAAAAAKSGTPASPGEAARAFWSARDPALSASARSRISLPRT